jgi:3-oxoacyl-[acyl-carrier protein] reductase
MDLGIRGRRALVFGGSRGMGRACARQLSIEGVHVVIAARTQATLEVAAREISTETGCEVVAPDILMNNADGPLPGDFRKWSRDDWIAALDMMMLGPIAMMRATVDGMIERRFGRIVNIVSRSVKLPAPELGLSNGARSGLVGFVAGLARQTVRHNVTINNLLPGIFATDAQKRHIENMLRGSGKTFDEVWRERAQANPARRFGDPAEIGAYCAFICSAHAGYITGQNLLIDGGGYPGTF